MENCPQARLLFLCDRRLENSTFDLVLTDLHMPDATGLDLLKNVRAMLGAISQIPVIVVTADVTTSQAPPLVSWACPVQSRSQ